MDAVKHASYVSHGINVVFRKDGKEKTLEEISNELHLTNERVRQIKDNALVKLRTEALMSDEFETYKELR